MAEPRVRFTRDDGSDYPPLASGVMGDYFTERNEPGDASLPFLTVSIHSGISDGELDEESLGKRVNRISDPAQNKKVEAGDLVFNMMRAWQGAVGCAKSAGMVSPAYIVATPDSCIHPLYMDLYVKTKPIIDQFNRLSYGALDFRKRLYWDSFIDTRVFLPCLEEQKKIADFLSSVDEVIVSSEQEVANLAAQKKVVMKKIFSQEVRFKRPDGSDFSEWEEAAISDISERIIVGLATTVTPYYREKGVPMFRNLNIRAGYLDDSNILYLDEEYASKQGGKYIHAGDILTVHTGNIGWSCVVPDCYEGALSFTTLITTLNSNGVTNDYVCTYLNSDLGMKQMQDLAFSGGRANLNTSEFQKVIVPIPCLEEQHLIADFLSDFDEAIAAAKKVLELWKELKKGLLQQMFV